MRAFTLICLLVSPVFTPGAATAEEIIAPADFEAFSTGSTLYFNRNDEPYGAEQYLKGRRVIWTFLDGQCQRGTWYAAGKEVCFLYETQTEPQCWHFLETEDGKAARVIGADPSNDLMVVGQNDEDLFCPGPGVGVSYSPGSSKSDF